MKNLQSKQVIFAISLIVPLTVVATVAVGGRTPSEGAPDYSAGASLQSQIAAYVVPVREARELQFARRPIQPFEIREVAWLWVLRARRGELVDIHQRDVRWQNPGATLNQIQRSRDWIALQMRQLAQREANKGNLVQSALDAALANDLPRIDLSADAPPLPKWAQDRAIEIAIRRETP